MRDDGSVALIDFDTARTFKSEAETDTRFFGTKGYAPPEQYGFTQTDCRADIFSFGVLLRFLLTGSTRDNANVRVYEPLANIIKKARRFRPRSALRICGRSKKALLAANPRSQFMRKALIALGALAACATLVFAGVKIYQYATFDLFTEGHIPAVLSDDERIDDAAAYMKEK